MLADRLKRPGTTPSVSGTTASTRLQTR
jgi:hypothetical protein